jgi:uncharacterized membrane protein YdbT with pleckstrin-like domain
MKKGRQDLGYIDKCLAREEKLLFRAHFHWLRYADAWMWFFIFSILGGLASLFGETGSFWLLGAGVALGSIALFVKLLPLWTTEIGVTDHRFIVKRGWLIRATNELQLRAIEEVSLDQGLIGRIFNFGRVNVQGTGNDDVNVPPVARPIELLRALQEATANAQKAARLLK